MKKKEVSEAGLTDVFASFDVEAEDIKNDVIEYGSRRFRIDERIAIAGVVGGSVTIREALLGGYRLEVGTIRADGQVFGLKTLGGSYEQYCVAIRTD